LNNIKCCYQAVCIQEAVSGGFKKMHRQAGWFLGRTVCQKSCPPPSNFFQDFHSG